jgi:hypothetical protein
LVSGAVAHPVKSATNTDEIASRRQYERIEAIMAGYMN